MPFTSYPELVSAATWYPAPPAYLPGYDDLSTLADLQGISWCFRGIVLFEGYPDLIGVHLTAMRVYAATLSEMTVTQPRSSSMTLYMSMLTPMTVQQASLSTMHLTQSALVGTEVD